VKAVVRHVDDHGHYYDALMFACPGCAEIGGSGLHMLPVSGDANGKPMWEWNGNLDAPTLSPSILTSKDEPTRRCHSFLKAGVMEFLSDCAHSLAGQHVPLPDLPDWALD
jgi:Family of unknown function (DUF6527)